MKVESGKKYPKSQSMLSIQVPGTGLDYFPKVNVCVRNTGSMTVSAAAKSTCDKVVKIAEDCKYLVDGFRDKTLIPNSPSLFVLQATVTGVQMVNTHSNLTKVDV